MLVKVLGEVLFLKAACVGFYPADPKTSGHPHLSSKILMVNQMSVLNHPKELCLSLETVG